MDGIGVIKRPTNIPDAIGASGELTGLITFLNAFLRLVFIAAGLFALFNIIIAGFDFIGAGGDPKNIAKAWEKIWQSALGLLIIVASFLLAAIIGVLFFGSPTAILQPTLPNL